MASVPHVYTGPTTALDTERFPPASVTEELAQFDTTRILGPRIVEGAVLAVTFWAVAMLIWACARFVVWADSESIAVLAAIGCAVIIYVAFGRRDDS